MDQENNLRTDDSQSWRVYAPGTQSFDPNRKNGGKRPPGKPPLRWIALAICIGVLAFSLFGLIRTAVQTRRVRETQEAHLAIIAEVQEETAPPPATATPAPTPLVIGTATPRPTATPVPTKPAIPAKYQALLAQNKDFIGWLKVDCLYRINFAVVQGSNSFYMDHDFDQKPNVNGAAFLDETCSIWPRDQNLLVYAHNMKSGDMFGELNKMQSASRIMANPLVYFDTLYEQGTYIPYAVSVCGVVQGEDYFQFHVRNFKTESAFATYVNRAKELSSVKLNTDVQYGDSLLTLVTCYDSLNTKRLVVFLRKLRADESPENALQLIFR